MAPIDQGTLFVMIDWETSTVRRYRVVEADEPEPLPETAGELNAIVNTALASGVRVIERVYGKLKRKVVLP